ncbi:4-(cytidine 5'-diphospho)-2-C-methyl-D-erythritol kinase [Shumkonia mesophila]|uniref:4-(cytidine 5'-diphospho)-2-C-methyl-D-erythritol kinase n=1 Tax=Shumkonia mesophila TaxID=2838854 RepID=UPI0029341477|nr:4-(cytidine 5'-diphospho)-2-C-methyl-D-erythritol kinase [Shumkonia mesophila]
MGTATAAAAATEIVRLAPAKVNLYLHVVGRRADGYHLLDSLIVFAGVGDDVAVAPARDLTLAVDGPFGPLVPAGPENLVLRAARALAERTGVKAGARIRLTKRLPVAAGIGGGSADAAAALKALCALWRVAPEPGAMADLALALGADVPVCLAGRPAFVGGIGEDIAPPPPLPPAWMVLVNPGVAVSTPQIFKARTGAFSAPNRFSAPPQDAPALFAALALCRNDLTAPALTLAPAIADVLAALAARPGCALSRMSGSGATCFGLFAEAGQAAAAAAAIAADHRQWWVQPAPMLTAAAQAALPA